MESMTGISRSYKQNLPVYPILKKSLFKLKLGLSPSRK